MRLCQGGLKGTRLLLNQLLSTSKSASTLRAVVLFGSGKHVSVPRHVKPLQSRLILSALLSPGLGEATRYSGLTGGLGFMCVLWEAGGGT